MQRYKFNQSLEDVVRFHRNTTTLKLKNVWDPKTKDLFAPQNGRFTSFRFTVSWKAVDKTVQYFDSILLKKQVKGKNPKFKHHSNARMCQKGQFIQKDPARFR